MASVGVCWGGEKLPQDEIALVVFSRPQADSVHRVPLLGAAASRTASVLLLPPDFGRFLRQHEAVTLVCYDSAELHWLLEDHFRQSNNAESLKTLWAYSQESRLIDIALLDQHVRRCQGKDGTVASPRVSAAPAPCGGRVARGPGDPALHCRRLTRMSQDPSDPAIKLALAVAAGVLRSYEQLLAEATSIMATVNQANQLPVVTPQLAEADEEEMQAQFEKLIENIPAPLPNTADRAAKPENAGLDGGEESGLAESRHYGPLGVGIDVQGAIALGKPDRPSLHIDVQQIDELRRENDRRFQIASRQLYDDPASRPCFQWPEGQNHERLVARGDDGLPLYHVHALKVWLRGVADKLCDINNLPASVPVTQRGDPSFDPESWGVWVACNRSLRAWRNMERAARFNHHLSRVAPCRPDYCVVPVFRSREPDLVALRSLRVPIFQPQSGHVFVVGAFPLLKVYCLAAIHQQGDPSPTRNVSPGTFLEATTRSEKSLANCTRI